MTASPPSPVRAPVALFIFNRPAHTERVFAAIAAARPAQLLIVADGPRPDHPSDAELVAEARAVVERVQWPCEVRRNYAEHNLGCGERIATGLDWVFAQAEETIVLEDDCLPEPTFFSFCDELLEHYCGDERVHMVSGFSALPRRGATGASYRFSRSYPVWGWATWRRAWRHYDYAMRAWPALRQTRWVEHHVRNRRAAHIARLFFDATYEGRLRQWDFQWVLAGWLRDAVAAVPTVNLVENIGHTEAGTHMRDPNHPLAHVPTEAMAFPLRHPTEVAVDEAADAELWQLVSGHYPRTPAAGRLLRRLRPTTSR